MTQHVFVRTSSNLHKDDKIMQGTLIVHLTSFMSTHYRVKHRCFKLLHNAWLLSP